MSNFPNGEDLSRIRLAGQVYVNGVKQDYTSPIERDDSSEDWVTKERMYDVKSPSDALAYLKTDDIPPTMDLAGDIELNGASKFTFYDITTYPVPKTPEITITPDGITDIPYYGYLYSIEINSNIIWEASVEGEGFHIDKTEGAGGEIINLIVDANVTPAARQGKVTIKSLSKTPVVTKTGYYTQEACPIIQTKPAEFKNIPYTENTQVIELDAAQAWTVTGPSWVTCTPSSGPGAPLPQGVAIKFSQNNGDTRYGMLTFTPTVGDPTEIPIQQAIGRHTIKAVSLQPHFGACSGSGLYMWNSPVTLIARPIVTAHFVKWEDGVLTNKRIITVGESDATYNAIFEINSFKLSVASSIAVTEAQSPEINVYLDDDPTCKEIAKVDYGATHVLHAVEGDSHLFDHWTLNGETISGGKDLTITMPNFEAVYTAVYVRKPYTVTLSHTTPAVRGHLYIDGEERMTKQIFWGDMVNILAVPTPAEIQEPGFHFTKWSDEVTDAERDELILADLTLAATFDPNVYIDVLPETSISFNANGTPVSRNTFDIDSNVAWHIETPADWPTGWSVSPMSGSDVGSVTVTVNKNNEYTVKNISLTFVPDEPLLTSKTRQITQEANKLTNLVVESLSYPEVDYNTPTTASPTLVYRISWLNGDTATTGATVNYELESGSWTGAHINSSTGVITWDENLMPYVRTAHVKVTVTLTDHGVTKTSTKTYDAKQKVAPNRFNINKIYYNFEDTPDTTTITVTGNIPWTSVKSATKPSGDISWMSLSPSDSGSATLETPYTTTVTVNVTDNDYGDIKEGKISFIPSDTSLSADFTIAQKVKHHTITVIRSSAPNEDGGPAAEIYLDSAHSSSSETLDIIHRSNHTINAVGTPSTDWVFDGWYNTSGVKVYSSPSVNINDIIADITLTAKWIYNVTWTLTSSSTETVDANVNTKTISFNTNLTWSAAKDDASKTWVTTSPMSGVGGDGSISCSFAKNSDTVSPTDRTITMTITCTDARPRVTPSPITVVLTQNANEPIEVKILTFEYADTQKTGGNVTPTLTYKVTWVEGTETTSGADITFTKISGDATLDPTTGKLTWAAFSEVTPRETVVNVYIEESGARTSQDDTKNATAKQYGRDIFIVTTVSNNTAWGKTNVDGGGVSKGIPDGDTCTINAVPEPHYHFVSWSDGGAQSHTLTVTAAVTVTATFAIDQFTVTLTGNYPTGTTATLSGAGTYDYNSTPTIGCSNVTTHYHFVKWVNSDGIEYTSTPLVIPSIIKNITYTAHTAIDRHTITVNKGSNITSVTGAGTYDYGYGIQISATPAAHYHFTKWTNASGTQISTSNPLSITVSEDATYVANAKIDQHTITLTTTPAATTRGMGSVTGGGTYNYGVTKTIKATNGTDYTFTSWSDSGAATHDITVNSTKTIKATFTFNPVWTLTTGSSLDVKVDGAFVTSNIIAFDSNMTWTATSSQTWLTLSASSGNGVDGGGTQTITLTAAQNSSTSSPADRSATVTIHCNDSRPSSAPADIVINVLQYANAPVSFSNIIYTYADTTKTGGSVTPTMTYKINWNIGTTTSGATKVFSKTSGDATLDSTSTGKITWDAFTETTPRTSVIALVLSASSPRGSISENLTATAKQYGRDTYTISTSSNDTAMGTTNVNGGGASAQIPEGDMYYIQAVPAAHYHLVKWNDGSTALLRENLGPVTGAASYSATFAIDQHTITLTAGTGGTVTGSGTYDYGASATIKATASTGYSFTKWSDNNTSATRTITVTGDKSLTATFTAKTYTITIVASTPAGGTGGTVSPSGAQSWVYNTTHTITATANTGYHFVKWDDGNTNASRSITVGAAAKTYTATFAIDTHTITVKASPTAGGTVTGGGTYDYGSTASLSATPATGYTFTKWSDSGAQSHDVTVTANKTYTATFTIKSYTVSLTAGTGGTVSGGGTYTHGASATITATPNTGYSFTKWSDGNTNASRTLTITSNVTLSATFTIKSYTITLVSSPTAGGTLTGGGTYNHGASATIKAVAKTGYTFSKWSDDGAAEHTVTVTANKTYTATFTLNKYTITLVASPTAGGTVTGGGTYDYGSTASLSATPATGYTFTKWSDSGAQSHDVTVTANKTYTATFTIKSYTVSLTAGTGGTVSGGGTYNHGASAAITATPNTGYSFTKWSDGNTNASRTLTITSNVTLSATFTINSYTITLKASPTAGGTVTGGGTYTYGSTKTISATAATGYTFSKWSDSGAQSHSITVTGAATYTATFTINKYTITVTASTPAGGTGGTVTGGGTYDYNSSVTIKATANSGYVFSQWNDGNTSATRTITVPASNKTYTATFLKSPSVTSITLT